MENCLSFTRKKIRILGIESFANHRSASRTTERFKVKISETPEKIHRRVIEHENKQRTGRYALTQRNISCYYWVTEYEVLTDNRSKFGHENQQSEKEVRIIIPRTYVRGEIMTLSEALAKSTNKKFSEDTKISLDYLITFEFNFDEKNLKDAELGRKVILIPGEHKQDTFFEIFDDTHQIKVFKKEELVGLRIL